jgi:hypothetical protein
MVIGVEKEIKKVLNRESDRKVDVLIVYRGIGKEFEFQEFFRLLGFKEE